MGIGLPTLIERFGSEEKCHAYLAKLRWPGGVRCPRCDSEKIGNLPKRFQYECSSCRYQFSVRVDTVFQDSKLPLWKWFLAIYITVESKKGVSANQLHRMLGVSYKTAWYLSHRIRHAMRDELPELLDGTVEIDETWVGGVKRGKGKGFTGNKSIVVAAIERGGEVRLRVSQSSDGKALGDFVRDYIAADVEHVYTDEWTAYPTIAQIKGKHETVNHNRDEWVRGDVHTNTAESVWSLFKRSIVGSYHQLSVKHLPAYLDEMAFRFNNRENPHLFRDTLKELLAADRLEYKNLTA
jgi:transposase-like protein